MKALSPEMSRLAAIGLLVVLLLITVLYVALPLLHYYVDRTSDLALKRRQLAQYDYLLGNEAAIDEELSQIEAANTGDLFLAGGNSSIASANLREFVAQAVRESGGELISSQQYEVEPIASTTAVGLRLQVRGEAGSLVGLLHAIESARPLIFIEELDITSSNRRNVSPREARRSKSRGDLPSLDIRMNVVGYLLGDEESQSESAG